MKTDNRDTCIICCTTISIDVSKRRIFNQHQPSQVHPGTSIIRKYNYFDKDSFMYVGVMFRLKRDDREGLKRAKRGVRVHGYSTADEGRLVKLVNNKSNRVPEFTTSMQFISFKLLLD